MTPVLPSLQWEGCFSAGTLTGTPTFPFSSFSQQILGRAFSLYHRKNSSARGCFCLGC